MEIEDKVFARKRWRKQSMLDCGFQEAGHDFLLEKDFMDGDFKAVLKVSDQGAVSGQVIDAMTGEEYNQLRRREADGAYVNMVRTAYEALLLEIASACCTDVLFASDQANRLADRIAEAFGVSPDYPFVHTARYQDYGVFRHRRNRKWFVLMMNVKRSVLEAGRDEMVDIVNLKIHPEEGESLCRLPGIYPAYHMNHRTWISVLLDDTVDDNRVMSLVKTSFDLTK